MIFPTITDSIISREETKKSNSLTSGFCANKQNLIEWTGEGEMPYIFRPYTGSPLELATEDEPYTHADLSDPLRANREMTGSWPGSKTNMSAWSGRSPGLKDRWWLSSPSRMDPSWSKWGKAEQILPLQHRGVYNCSRKWEDPPAQQIVAKWCSHSLKAAVSHKHIWHERVGESSRLYVFSGFWSDDNSCYDFLNTYPVPDTRLSSYCVHPFNLNDKPKTPRAVLKVWICLLKY